jgi:hypothetical protein
VVTSLTSLCCDMGPGKGFRATKLATILDMCRAGNVGAQKGVVDKSNN